MNHPQPPESALSENTSPEPETAESTFPESTSAEPQPSSPPSPSWDRLVSTALVGTSRRPVPALPDLPRSTREGAAALLDLVALDTVRTRAGYTAHTAEPVTPDAPDHRPEVSAAATHRLDVILADRPELLPEWLYLAFRCGRRASHTHLPDLLERAARDSGLRTLVATAVGGRGTWLASFNGAWSFVAREPLATDVYTDAAWHGGTPAERRRSLFALRAVDPAAARDLLAAAWPRETRGEERRGLLEALVVNLGPEDEAVLAPALDDRNATVRGRALTLLTHLPDSAHAHRLRDHLRHHLRIDRASPRPVDVADLDTGRADLLRDLALTAPRKANPTHDERWVLSRTLVTQAPLDVWTEVLGTDPAGVLALAADHPELRSALIEAACLREDADWSRAVLDDPETGLPRMVAVGAHDPLGQRIAPLLAALPEAEQCARALAVAERAHRHDFLGETLRAVCAPWTRELSEAAVRLLVEGGSGDPADSRPGSRHSDRDRGRGVLRWAIAERMPPQHLDLLPERPPHEEEAHPHALLRDTLRFRLDMHRELS
ncbi:DUF5691 domain-containing protein [Nocardiopsis exhalans]|uniref:DUF5691 domain-containing protein n=1 Tax=Nocardiopsis exhalans TaxID=163604 RepID=A0ABY5D873_9ACTN|nr:DUF5691 domain-containing protein [Nocardiopsis exhalans]USY20537.1 DUF5691 domain-containing protein [Nocardiopsis exhalans]